MCCDGVLIGRRGGREEVREGGVQIARWKGEAKHLCSERINIDHSFFLCLITF